MEEEEEEEEEEVENDAQTRRAQHVPALRIAVTVTMYTFTHNHIAIIAKTNRHSSASRSDNIDADCVRILDFKQFFLYTHILTEMRNRNLKRKLRDHPVDSAKSGRVEYR